MCVKQFIYFVYVKKMWQSNYCTNHSHLCELFCTKIVQFIIHNRIYVLSCSRAFDRYTAVSVTVMAPGEATSCHLGGHDQSRTNQAEIHNVPVTESECVWLDAHTNGLVTFCHRSRQGFLLDAFF